MNGTNNEVFFKESRRTKRERLKWFVILITTNLMTLLLMLPSSSDVPIKNSPWPEDWVEMNLNAQVMASGNFPIAVTILDQSSKVIIKKAYLLESKNNCATFNNDQLSRFMLSPQDLSLINSYKQLRVLPFSKELISSNSHIKQITKRESYEIRF